MRDLPRGTVTFLFTDIEGSTRLLHELGDAYGDALAEHRRALRLAFSRHGGVEVDTQGDAFFVAFTRASDALAAAQEGQEGLEHGSIRVRMGIHTGEPVVTDDGYVGVDVHRAARVAAVGHGGQVLVSQATRELVAAEGLRDLGEHRLKDLTAPERIYQLGGGDFPPLKSLNHTNLPIAASPLVGRQRELRELVDLLSDGARLVTLVGSGGTGKTRLALQAAAELSASYEDVWFVPLAPLRDPDLVLPTVAQTVSGGGDLHNVLRGRRTLLVLDNFEHVLEAAARIGELLAFEDGVRILTTSRSPLRVGAEHEVPLDPLPDFDAATLFVERARAVGRSLEIDDAVFEVCRRLDGLPLAIELAAARAKLLDPEVLLQRLDRRLPLLTGGRRDAPERQRTLRDTVGWSYGLLDEELQRVFRWLSIFAGGFSADAAEDVCGASIDAVAALLDASLLKSLGTGRFLMLETIREYGLDELRATGEADSSAARHADYFRRMAEEAEPHLVGSPAQSQWFARLEEELDNLRSALSFFRATGNEDAEFALASASWEFWWLHGYANEGRGHLLHAVEAGVPLSRAGANALEGAAYLAYLEGDLEDANRWATELLELAQRLQDSIAEAKAWHMFALLSESDDERVAFEKRALELARGDPIARFSAELLGTMALRHGDVAEARQHLDQVRAISTSIDDTSTLSTALILLAFVSLAEGNDAEAGRLVSEGARLGRTVGDVTPMIWERCWIAVAEVFAQRGSPERGFGVLGAAERLREEMAARPLRGFTAELHDQAVARIEAALGTDEASRAWAEGRRCSSQEYLDQALREVG